MTRAPAFASWIAVAAPIPLEAPVTSAVFPRGFIKSLSVEASMSGCWWIPRLRGWYRECQMPRRERLRLHHLDGCEYSSQSNNLSVPEPISPDQEDDATRVRENSRPAGERRTVRSSHPTGTIQTGLHRGMGPKRGQLRGRSVDSGTHLRAPLRPFSRRKALHLLCDERKVEL